MPKVYTSFMFSYGWCCQFLEEGLKTSVRCKFTFATDDKVTELAEKGGGLKDLVSRQALQHGIENGHGGVFLNLTSEQYAKLKMRGYLRHRRDCLGSSWPLLGR
jgi:hypothetical protein